MSAVGIRSESLDETALQAIMIRCKLAQLYLKSAEDRVDAGRLAIEMLVGNDIPVLLREIVRMRTESV